MDIAKSETFKNFIILNKALLFLIKFLLWFPKKGQCIGVPDFRQFSNRCNWNNTFLIQAANFSKSSVAYRKISCGPPVGHDPLVEKPWFRCFDKV